MHALTALVAPLIVALPQYPTRYNSYCVSVQEPLRAELEGGNLPRTTVVSGALDAKYVGESEAMLKALQSSPSGQAGVAGTGDGQTPGPPELACRHTRVMVPECGHAVHIEQPLALLQALLAAGAQAP